MNKEPISEENKKVRASREEFKNFCQLNSHNKKTFYELNCITFKFLYLLWSRESNKNSEEMPAFNLIMQKVRIFV
mgnify:CR=1 FL=1